MTITYQDVQTQEFFNSKLTDWSTVDKPEFGLKFQKPAGLFLYQNTTTPVEIKLIEGSRPGALYSGDFSTLGVQINILPKPENFENFISEQINLEKSGLRKGIYTPSEEAFSIGTLKGISILSKSGEYIHYRTLYVLGKNYLLSVTVPELANGDPSINTLMDYYLGHAIINRINFN